MELGNDYLEDKSYEEAITAFTIALEEKPEDEEATKLLARSQEELEKEQQKEREKAEQAEKEKREEEERKAQEDSMKISDEEFEQWVKDLIETGDGIIDSVEPYLPDDWEVTNVYVSADFFTPDVSEQLRMVESVGPAVEDMVVNSGKWPYTAVYFRYIKDDRIVAEPKTFGGYTIK